MITSGDEADYAKRYGKANEKNVIRFLTFVSFFPQLVAGPIERAGHLLPQLQQTPAITRQGIADGLSKWH